MQVKGSNILTGGMGAKIPKNQKIRVYGGGHPPK